MFPTIHGVVSQGAAGGGGDPGGVPYRYYRINVTANNGRNTTNIAELELRAEIGGANIATGGTPSASTAAVINTVADKAFDGNPTTFWSTTTTNGGVPNWLKYDLGAGNAAVVAQYTIRARHDASNGAPRDWTFEGSNDDSTWDVLDTVTGETGWSNGETRAYTV